MQKLTKREKILLQILLYIAILSVGIFLLILPAQSAYLSLQDEKSAVQGELAFVKGSVINYGDLEKELADAKEALAVQKDKFYSDMEIEDVDELLTKMVTIYGLIPTSFQTTGIELEELMSYPEYLAMQSKEATLEDSSVDEISVYHVSMSVEGSIANVQSFVNDASLLKSLRVSGVRYTTSTADTTSTITFKMYIR